MLVGLIKISIYIPWSHSLKEKRKEMKSIIQKLKNKFNISVIEYEHQDLHQNIYLGIVFGVNDMVQFDQYSSTIINYIDSNVDGEVSILENSII